MARRLGIFGGAFDPVHEGHLHVARLAQRELNLDKVYFLPLNQAVHKAQPKYSAERRVELLRKALEPRADFALLLTDIERGGLSYAVDTLEFLLKQPDFTGADLYYIIGSDAFAQIFTWKNPDKLLTLARFIVVFRPGASFSRIERLFAGRERFLDQIYLIEDAGVDISSTRMRERGVGRL
ncbi:nicotinate nucleotide adenylyltransferase [Candidatus Termititenax persephonae]|uniref:Probable nicotinate-nucleotide adenylyltransferase n=1 Tax=Candidatus Termititenax persephonae TaxID=2218525 RepID=A0A388TEK4_9BACT|nr:nicotinate nucleotide adenylyltransferase [Candidatus Termititenax persephonae]